MTAPIAAQRAPPGLPSLRGPLLGTWSHTLCGIPPLGKFLASVVWTIVPSQEILATFPPLVPPQVG